MDPAVIDRTTRPILGIDEGDQRLRPMTVAGIEGSIHAKILSTDLRGAATRIVRMKEGWGSRLAGAFSADVEVFVLQGNLYVGSTSLTDYEYAFIPGDGVVGAFRSESGAVALLMTSGPIRYDTSTGGRRADVVVGRPSETSWQVDAEVRGLFRRPVATTRLGEVWLGSTQLDPETQVWHSHPHDDELFVLEGSIACSDLLGDQSLETTAGPGSYFYRPKSTVHTAPTARTEGSIVTFNRSFGAFESMGLEYPPDNDR